MTTDESFSYKTTMSMDFGVGNGGHATSVGGSDSSEAQVQLACRSFAGNRSQSFLIVVQRRRRRERWRISPRGQRRERGEGRRERSNGGSGYATAALARSLVTHPHITPHRGPCINDICAGRGTQNLSLGRWVVWISY